VSLGVVVPLLSLVVTALVPGEVSVVRVVVSVNPEASTSDISDVSVSTVKPSSSLEGLGSPVSHSSGIAEVLVVSSSLLDGHDVVSVGNRSNGLSSPVEDPPLLAVIWIVVVDSKSEISVSDMLSPDNSSVSAQSGLDLESNTVSEWVSWEVNSSSVKRPGLTHMVLAGVVVNVSSFSVGSLDLHTLSTWVSNVSGSSWEEGGSVHGLVDVSSDDGVVSESEV